MNLIEGLSVVVPVYNSEGTLKTLAKRFEAVIANKGEPFELILVNDGSRDSSWTVVTELSKAHGWIRGFNFFRNYGQHSALLCGIRAARFDTVVTMDDDLQNPPEEIHKLLEELNKGFDVVYGRPSKEQHGLMRDLASVVAKLVLQRAMGAQTARHISAFRALRTRLRNTFVNFHGPNPNLDVLLTWSSTKFSSIPVQHDPRTIGRSNYTFLRLFAHALTMMTGFSTIPLRLASIIGFAFSFFGVMILAFVLTRFMLIGTPVQGFPFLASTIAIFSGAQLFALGIIGEYLAQMHFRSMQRPTYVILDEVGIAGVPGSEVGHAR